MIGSKIISLFKAIEESTEVSIISVIPHVASGGKYEVSDIYFRF